MLHFSNISKIQLGDTIGEIVATLELCPEKGEEGGELLPQQQ